MVTVYKYNPDVTNESSLFQHSVFPFHIFLSTAVNTVWTLSTQKENTGTGESCDWKVFAQFSTSGEHNSKNNTLSCSKRITPNLHKPASERKIVNIYYL